MSTLIEILKALIYGLVEGVTEWLPISSTGHMILLDEFLGLNVTDAFWNLFLVVIQFGAILAVVVLYWNKLWPFGLTDNRPYVKKDILLLWVKCVICCIPAAVVGLLFDDKLDELFYNPTCVALALIVFGIGIIATEIFRAGQRPRIRNVMEITYKDALLLGLFQVVAAIFPGASRSGLMIIGGLLLGLNRRVAARFSFYVAVPVMAGASLLKMVKFIGNPITVTEVIVLLVGMASAFIVSMVVIRTIMNYVRTHNFKIFGYYRIALGILVLVYFGFFAK
ncbi:MAG: undecaprenyl-diphosphate phosphatase [Lachnospiraceae bacterium]|nr:undecaprenyl-diphosphate phosphatase [Lachnospiraceae bacterium]MBQ9593469.1 undecaprenyl-diphosphate phosphatase [Lachnospiraceae bacterium]